MNWLSHLLGLDNGSGRWYLWWSGMGANLGEFAIVGALSANVRRHNCHVEGCWRIGRHPVIGTAFICCRKHTPNGAPTHAQVVMAHHLANKPPEASHNK